MLTKKSNVFFEELQPEIHHKTWWPCGAAPDPRRTTSCELSFNAASNEKCRILVVKHSICAFLWSFTKHFLCLQSVCVENMYCFASRQKGNHG